MCVCRMRVPNTAISGVLSSSPVACGLHPVLPYLRQWPFFLMVFHVGNTLAEVLEIGSALPTPIISTGILGSMGGGLIQCVGWQVCRTSLDTEVPGFRSWPSAPRPRIAASEDRESPRLGLGGVPVGSPEQWEMSWTIQAPGFSLLLGRCSGGKSDWCERGHRCWVTRTGGCSLPELSSVSVPSPVLREGELVPEAEVSFLGPWTLCCVSPGDLQKLTPQDVQQLCCGHETGPPG